MCIRDRRHHISNLPAPLAPALQNIHAFDGLFVRRGRAFVSLVPVSAWTIVVFATTVETFWRRSAAAAASCQRYEGRFVSARRSRTRRPVAGLICKQWDGPRDRPSPSASGWPFTADYRETAAVNSDLSSCRCGASRSCPY